MPIESKNPVISNCRLHHVTVQTRDWDASLRLYCDVLGMQLVARFGSEERRVILLDVGDGSHIELIAPTANSPAPGSPTYPDPLVHVALGTADAAGSVETVREAGFEITVEPKRVKLGSMTATVAFFRGPNGEEIEFFQTH